MRQNPPALRFWAPLGGAGILLAAMAFLMLRSAPETNITSTISPADLTATEFCSISTAQAGSYVMIWDMWGTPTPTPTRADRVPGAGPTLTPSATWAAAPGDAQRGAIVFNSVGTCNACHRVSDDSALVGPSLKGIASRAAAKKPGLSAEDYVRTVILNPDEVIMTQARLGVMPRTFAKLLSAQQINDLVAYLMTLK